jgi:hypothetical protein
MEDNVQDMLLFKRLLRRTQMQKAAETIKSLLAVKTLIRNMSDVTTKYVWYRDSNLFHFAAALSCTVAT